MDRFKIAHFESGNTGIPFPKFETLSSAESQAVKEGLAKRLGLHEKIDNFALLKHAVELETAVGAVDAAGDFDFQTEMQKWGIHPQKLVCINWKTFESVDRIAWEDLTTYFDDIWYPGSDDIDIFDFTFGWLLSVTHGGVVKVAKF